LGISKLVSQLVIASLVEYGCFELSIPKLDKTSRQVYAISISLVDMLESVVVQIGLGICDVTLLPDNKLLTAVVGFPQCTNKDRLGRNAEDALRLYVFTLAQESSCFS
jgi:hypothetical protein